jgi:hypothetical protein
MARLYSNHLNDWAAGAIATTVGNQGEGKSGLKRQSFKLSCGKFIQVVEQHTRTWGL